MKDYTKTKVCYSVLQADQSTKQYITSENAWNKIVADAKEKKEEPPTLVASQTFGYKEAESVDEAVSLSGGSGVGEYENVVIFLQVFNYGASLRQENAANDVLQSENFEQRDGALDVSFAIAQKVERARMTPQEQAVKALAKAGINISPDQLKAALAMIMSQSATAQVGAGS